MHRTVGHATGEKAQASLRLRNPPVCVHLRLHIHPGFLAYARNSEADERATKGCAAQANTATPKLRGVFYDSPRAAQEPRTLSQNGCPGRNENAKHITMGARFIATRGVLGATGYAAGRKWWRKPPRAAKPKPVEPPAKPRVTPALPEWGKPPGPIVAVRDDGRGKEGSERKAPRARELDERTARPLLARVAQTRRPWAKPAAPPLEAPARSAPPRSCAVPADTRKGARRSQDAGPKVREGHKAERASPAARGRRAAATARRDE